MQLVGTILMPAGQAYEVYSESVPPLALRDLADRIEESVATGKPLVFAAGLRVLAVQPGPPMGIVRAPKAATDEQRARWAESIEKLGRSGGAVFTLPKAEPVNSPMWGSLADFPAPEWVGHAGELQISRPDEPTVVSEEPK